MAGIGAVASEFKGSGFSCNEGIEDIIGSFKNIVVLFR